MARSAAARVAERSQRRQQPARYKLLQIGHSRHAHQQMEEREQDLRGSLQASRHRGVGGQSRWDLPAADTTCAFDLIIGLRKLMRVQGCVASPTHAHASAHDMHVHTHMSMPARNRTSEQCPPPPSPPGPRPSPPPLILRKTPGGAGGGRKALGRLWPAGL